MLSFSLKNRKIITNNAQIKAFLVYRNTSHKKNAHIGAFLCMRA